MGKVIKHSRNASVLEFLIVDLLTTAFDIVTAGDNLKGNLGKFKFCWVCFVMHTPIHFLYQKYLEYEVIHKGKF